MPRLIPFLVLAFGINNSSIGVDAGSVQRTAATYYVSAAGSDSNDGTSPATAWQSLQKVNSWTFVAGDTLRFRGGDRFSGSLTNQSLSGSPDAVVKIDSYGTGNAIIDGGQKDGVHLINAEFLELGNLNLEGSGWRGRGSHIVPTNGGICIWIENSRTSGSRLRNIAISHCKVSGFYVGVLMDTRQPNTTGFENVKITGNNFSDNLTMGFNLEGWNSNIAGPVDQNREVYVGYNTIQRVPGDPNSGAGGIHGTFRTEAGGLQVANTTGTTIEHNLVTDIAGLGGLKTGLTWGGSTAIVVTNGRQFRIVANEVARTACITYYDASAIDADQDEQDGEIYGNLTYNNIGPAIQIGSYGGKVTGRIRIHHNISYNDVRGNNANGISEQGAIRIWGSTDDLKIFNNTIFVDKAQTKGTPSAINFEQVEVKPGDYGRNDRIEVVNNIFKTTRGVPIFWANEETNKTPLGVYRAFGNVYDASGGKLVIANRIGSKEKAVTTLAGWRKAGFEELNGSRYGVAGDAGLQDVAGFSPPLIGFMGSGQSISEVRNFDLKPNSASIGAGVDPASLKLDIDLGPVSFHGTPSRVDSRVDAGACPYKR